MNVHLRSAPPIETKDAGEDDIADAIANLAEDVKKWQTDLETKVAKMIADAVKPISDQQIEAEKKAGRPFSRAGVPGSETKEIDEEHLRANRELLGMFFKQSGQNPPPDLRQKMLEHVAEMQSKAMSVGSDPDGGYLMQDYRSPVIRKKLLDLSPMRRISGGISLPYGDAYEEPTDDDDAGAGWVAETEARPETKTPQVGIWRVPLHEIYAAPKVTQKLLDLSNFDVGLWLEGKIGDRFGQLEGTAFVTGNGIGKPRGFLTYPVSATADATRAAATLQSVASGSATLLTPDGLIAMTWALRAGYRQNASWVMNSQTAAAINTFKDTTGRYIWQTSLVQGSPNLLLGYPVLIDEGMPNVGSGAMPVAFGDFSRGYFIPEWSGLRLLRDPYTAKPHVIFYAYKRVGGDVRDFDAVKLLVVSAT